MNLCKKTDQTPVFKVKNKVKWIAILERKMNLEFGCIEFVLLIISLKDADSFIKKRYLLQFEIYIVIYILKFEYFNRLLLITSIKILKLWSFR